MELYFFDTRVNFGESGFEFSEVSWIVVCLFFSLLQRKTSKKQRGRWLAHLLESYTSHFAASSVYIRVYIRKMLQNYIDEHIKQNRQAGTMCSTEPSSC